MATIVGTSDADTLVGSGSADTLSGGGGGDVVTGGAGFDLFVIGGGDSPAAAGLSNLAALDTITDWSGADRLLFSGAGPAGFASVVQTSAEDYTSAYNQAVTLYGQGFEYAAIRVNDDVFVFAIRTNAAVRLPGASFSDLQRVNFDSGSLDGGLVETGGAGDDLRTLTPGADRYDGADGSDITSGLGGNDTLSGGAGNDQVFGGLGNDVVNGGDGSNYLRGDEGDDLLNGGAGFDDINGNMGNDTIFGGASTDLVVGGKDEDIIFGEGGADIVYGNIGNDTVAGGPGDDIVRGGQGDDVVRGDDGNDIIAGDRGMDTITGGLGADIFLTFGDAGIDRVQDFNAGEGDRVQLDPGTQFTLSQVGADVIIDMVGGGRMILENTTLSSLPNGWIFGN